MTSGAIFYRSMDHMLSPDGEGEPMTGELCFPARFDAEAHRKEAAASRALC